MAVDVIRTMASRGFHDFRVGHVAHFDRAAATWAFSSTASGSTNELSVDIPGSEPDPISGQIVLVSRSGLSLYDPATRSYVLEDGPDRDRVLALWHFRPTLLLSLGVTALGDGPFEAR